jgi:hypothetical protein
MVSPSLHAVIEDLPLGARSAKGFEPFSCYRGFTRQKGTMKHKLTLPGLAGVLSLSPSVAMAGPLEKPVQPVSLGDCVNHLYGKPKKNYFIASRRIE